MPRRTPQREHPDPRERSRGRNVLVQAWNGVAPLWKAFWLVGVCGQLLVAVGTEFLLGFVPRSILHKSALIWAGTTWLTYLIYAVFSSICIWRCARNASSPIWGDLSIAVIALNGCLTACGILMLLATGGS